MSTKNNNISRRDFVSKASLALGSFMIVPRHVLGGKKADGSRYLAPSDIISLGFIGTGKQGRGLTSSFLNTNEVRIAALSEVYQAKAQLTLDRIKMQYEKNTQLGAFSEIPVYQDFRELLNRKDIDAVVIATPDHWHAAIAVRAAEAGKYIYCEKKENNEPNEKKYIQKEYNYAAFKRTFALPQDVNKNKIDAKYEDGILNILLPFNEDVKQTPIKRIAVK